MLFLKKIVSFIDKNFNLILFWLYNKKVDEVKRLEAQVAVIKEETEIANKTKQYTDQKQESDNKVLTFKQKMKEYKGESHE